MAGPFAQETGGPATATGKNTNQQALIYDKQNNIVEAVGNAGVAAALHTTLAPILTGTAGSSTAATPILTVAVPNNAFNKKARTVKVEGTFTYVSPGGSTPTLTIALVLGAKTLATITTGAISTTASTGMPVKFNFEFAVTTNTNPASAVVRCNFEIDANLTANTPAAATTRYIGYQQTTAVPLNVAQTLEVTLLASSAISSATLNYGKVDILN